MYGQELQGSGGGGDLRVASACRLIKACVCNATQRQMIELQSRSNKITG
jgi:hypothetical protein